MDYDLEEILTLIKKKVSEQGAYDFDAYKEVVEETVAYFIEKGKLSEDDNLEFIKDQLLELWDDVESELAE